MADIVPTITAYDPHEYREYMEKLETFAQHIHIDLMDGVFAPTKSPGLEEIWWPAGAIIDVHLMYQHPMEEIDKLLKLRPNLVIIHAEADVDHLDFASKLNEGGIRAGLALLAESPVGDYLELLPSFDHALIFSGKLGYHGGMADMRLLNKVSELHEKFPHLEIGWDGGVNLQSARDLSNDGVNILNTGGFIRNAEDPKKAYEDLKNSVY